MSGRPASSALREPQGSELGSPDGSVFSAEPRQLLQQAAGSPAASSQRPAYQLGARLYSASLGEWVRNYQPVHEDGAWLWQSTKKHKVCAVTATCTAGCCLLWHESDRELACSLLPANARQVPMLCQHCDLVSQPADWLACFSLPQAGLHTLLPGSLLRSVIVQSGRLADPRLHATEALASAAAVELWLQHRGKECVRDVPPPAPTLVSTGAEHHTAALCFLLRVAQAAFCELAGSPCCLWCSRNDTACGVCAACRALASPGAEQQRGA